MWGIKIRKNISGVIFILIFMLFLSISVMAIPNPSAAYCEKMGYIYKIDKTPEGEKGICIVDSGIEFKAWDFFKGKVGEEYSYCVKEGYGTKTEYVDKETYSEEYAVCVPKEPGEREIPMHELMEKNGIPLVNVKSASEDRKDKQISDKEHLDILQEDNSAQQKDLVELEGVGDPPPSSFDWRDYNGEDWVTPVKDQESCGSCWAFSAVGATESKLNIDYSNSSLDYDLSEQQLVSCSDAGDCDGGLHYSALDYIINTGVADEDCLPYTASNSACNLCSDWEDRVAYITNYHYVTNTQADYKQALIDYGPLSIVVNATHWPGYSGGIYIGTDQGNSNHAVLLVGYNDTGNYWIVKNSWAEDWGENGYIRLSYTNNPITTFDETYAVEQTIKPGKKAILEPYLIDPISSIYVIKNQFFNFSTGVKCVNGSCGNVSATLSLPPSQPTTCSDIWGGDCSEGPPESFDNTFDSCSSGAGGDESINEIYLDKSELNFGEAIIVTCYFDAKGLAPGLYYPDDDLFIYYRNSPSGAWVQKYAVTENVIPDTNYSITFVPDSVEGEHQVRCNIVWNEYGLPPSPCVDGSYNQYNSYYDNDDANFSVYNYASGKGKVPMDYGSPFYTINQNPINCTDMTNQSACNQTWTINATGNLNSNWLLYTIYTSNFKGVKTKETERINVTIIEVPDNYPPEIHSIECHDGSSWVDCSTLIYDDIIEQVRANCTDSDGSIINASFKLKNIPDNNTFFDYTTTTNIGDWWLYDNTDIKMQDSGDWELSVICTDNENNQSSDSVVWNIPFGVLQPYLIDPVSDKNVSQNDFFNFSSGVLCFGGECGSINASLDPATDRTPRTCSVVWGASCDGSDPTTSDYSYDSCSVASYYTNGFWVDEVTVDATIAAIGDTINITCTFDCYSTSSYNDLAISYYNGSWNQIWKQDSSCTDGNYSTTVKISGDIGEQKVRCQIGYNANNPTGTCFTTAYADNDDVNFTVIESEKGIIPINNGTPFYTIDENPTTCQNLKGGNSCNQTWTLNATGQPNTYEFFTIYTPVNYSAYLNESETQHINVTIMNEPPLLASIDNITINKTQLITIIANATDPNGDALTYYINDSRFDQNDNIFTWQTGFDDAGNYSILITVSDGELNDSQVVHINVQDVEPQCTLPTDGMEITTDTIFCNQPQNVYNLPNGIKVRANDITIDCNNVTIYSDKNNYGIYLNRTNRTIIKNCHIEKYRYGVYLYYSNNNKLENINSSDNYYTGIYSYYSPKTEVLNSVASLNDLDYGVYLYYSNNITIKDSEMRSNSDYGVYSYHSDNLKIINNNLSKNYDPGIYLYYSDNCLIENNYIASNSNYGIHLSSSSYNNLTNNTLYNNNRNIYISGASVNFYNHLIDTSNTIDNKAVYYYFSADGITLENVDAGHIEFANSTNILINNITVNNADGIKLDYTTNSTIKNSISNYNRDNQNIQLYYSNGNKIQNCIANSSYANGIYLYYSDYNEISNNTAKKNDDGIYTYYSDYNTIVGNNLSNNNYNGIRLYYGSNNNVTNNNASQNSDYGIIVFHSHNNKINDNHIDKNYDGGISLYYSSYADLNNNKMRDNNRNLYIPATTNKNNYNHTIPTSNSVNDKPVYYYFNIDGIVLENLDAGHVEFAHCNNISIRNVNVSYADGIKLDYTTNSTIKNSISNYNRDNQNIQLYYSNGNKIENCIANSSDVNGIHLYYSDYNEVSNNTAKKNDDDGIYIYYGYYNTIVGNNLTNNNYNGIRLYYGSNNNVTNNKISGSSRGLYFYYSKNNSIIFNNILSNSYGAYLYGTSYGNDFEYNNIYSNPSYNMYNSQIYNISAINNWWGTTNKTIIMQKIYDHNDSTSKGYVFFEPYLLGEVGILTFDLNQGWNLFSPIISPTDQNTNKSIQLKKGWNMFGYSSNEPFYWSDGMLSNGTDLKNISEAGTSGWIQSTIYYYNSSSGMYGFVPDDDAYLRKNKGYWLYAFKDNLILTLPDVGGSLAYNSFYWLDVNVNNGNETKTLAEAQSSGWLQGTIYYFDENSQYYKFVPGDDNYIYPWRGYWLYSNEDDLSLIIS